VTTIGIITQARTTSTRLPGKVLAALGDSTVLDLHLDRLATSGLPVFVATTTNRSDDAIVTMCERRGVAYHRGSEADVLSRFDGCAGEQDLDVVVRVTSDCPLVDGSLIAAAVERYVTHDEPRLYLANTLERSFPRGFDFEVFGTDLLREAATRAREPFQREHVTPYLYDGSAEVVLENVAAPSDHSDLRVTVDTADDLELVRGLVDDHDAATLDWQGIVDVLRSHPGLVALNAHVVQKAGAR
jgi:spore coat polysaccharide biosynthesis protein SpsF